jgi:hypothetical protein
MGDNMVPYLSRWLAHLAALPALVMATLAHAEPAEIKGYYAALSGELDDADFRELQAELAVPFGETGWVQLDVGRTTASSADDDMDMTSLGLRTGFSTGNVDWRAMYTYREDGSSYTQHDLFGAFTYVASRGTVGLDLFYRSAEYESIASIQRRFRDPLAIRVVETTEGTGIGAHGELYITRHVTLSSSVMVYDYDDTSNVPASLSRFERVSLSGVTRDEAYLMDSINVGVTYEFAVLSLGAIYYRDREVESNFVTDTAEIYADVTLTERWALAAWIGHAMTEDDAELTYGGARISVVW